MDTWEDPFVRWIGDEPPPSLGERIIEHTLTELATHTIQAVVELVHSYVSERYTLTQRVKELEEKVTFLLNDIEFIDEEEPPKEKVVKPKRTKEPAS